MATRRPWRTSDIQRTPDNQQAAKAACSTGKEPKRIMTEHGICLQRRLLLQGRPLCSSPSPSPSENQTPCEWLDVSRGEGWMDVLQEGKPGGYACEAEQTTWTGRTELDESARDTKRGWQRRRSGRRKRDDASVGCHRQNREGTREKTTENRQRAKRIQDVASRWSTDRYRDLSSGGSAVDAWKSGLSSPAWRRRVSHKTEDRPRTTRREDQREGRWEGREGERASPVAPALRLTCQVTT